MIDLCRKGISYTGITHPNAFCMLRPYCPIGGRQPPVPEQLPPTGFRSRTKIGLPAFIPIISVMDRRSWFWTDFQLPMVVVRLAELIGKRGILSQVSKTGLQDFLGYDGRIILSTIMPDELIDELEHKDYLRLITELKPDATMIPDNYTYYDDPLYLSWSQTIRLARNAFSFLELEMPVIGLIKGAVPGQVSWSMQRLIEMGYVTFALPARELSQSSLLDLVSIMALRSLEENKLDGEIMVYGPSHKYWRLKKASYASLSWFLEAKGGAYFKGGVPYDITDTNIRFGRCDCEVCRGKMAQDLVEDVQAIASHNLLDLNRTLGGGR